MNQPVRAALLVAFAAAFAGCASHQQPASGTAPALAETAGPWQSLFDGHSMDQWRAYKGQSMDGWHVVDGTMTKSQPTGDIITKSKYANFELDIDWKIGKAGNSGIFYRGTEEYDHIYWSAPEYQLLDDANAPDGKLRITSAGSDYAVYPSPAGYLHPAGEWNSTRIVVNGNHVEHWLNGHKLLAYELGSADWTARVKASKFHVYPNYGKAATGYIGIQGDHEGDLALRNIRIRELH
ncbi:MAG: 3-keto-disaccharide hydrolase [Gemmatimonadaceae bacterium]